MPFRQTREILPLSVAPLVFIASDLPATLSVCSGKPLHVKAVMGRMMRKSKLGVIAMGASQQKTLGMPIKYYGAIEDIIAPTTFPKVQSNPESSQEFFSSPLSIINITLTRRIQQR